MKKILLFLFAALLMMPVEAQNNAFQKEREKAQKKEYKVRMKQYKKEGWTLFGSAHSLDVALLNHYAKLAELGDNGYELTGFASRFKSKNVGHQQAINNACLTYAQTAGSDVKGRIVSDMKANGVEDSGELDNFYAAYQTLVEKEIKGELTESLSVIRDLGHGEYEMQTIFIVNQDAASKARIRAMENALRESEAAQKYAQKVSDFVREGFKQE